MEKIKVGEETQRREINQSKACRLLIKADGQLSLAPTTEGVDIEQ